MNSEDLVHVHNVSTPRLVFLGLLVLTPILTPGSIGAFTSICLPQMKLNVDEQSWFASIVTLTDPLGSLLIGLIVDKYGRRVSMLVSLVPNTVGWFLLADRNAPLARLYFSRLLTGFAVGACSLPSLIYAAECITINHVRIRGSVGTLVNMTMAFGGLLVYALSVISITYDRIALVLGSLSTWSLLSILIFVPESPTWLCQKGRVGEAEIAWRRLGMKRPILRNHAVSMTAPAAALAISPTVSPPSPPDDRSSTKLVMIARYLSQIRKREVYKPLLIATFFAFFCEFSGLHCVINFMMELITVPGLEIDPYVLSLVGQVLQIVGCLLTSFMLPALGIRALSMVSFFLISTGFIALAFSVLYENPSTPNILNYVHVAAVWTIMLAAMAVMGIGGAILGEMFPMGAKGFAALASIAASAFSFIMLKLFPYMLERHKSVTFFAFGAVSACGVVFVMMCLPETVGKTLDEIKEAFRHDAKSRSNNVEESRVPVLANSDRSLAM